MFNWKSKPHQENGNATGEERDVAKDLKMLKMSRL